MGKVWKTWKTLSKESKGGLGRQWECLQGAGFPRSWKKSCDSINATSCRRCSFLPEPTKMMAMRHQKVLASDTFTVKARAFQEHLESVNPVFLVSWLLMIQTAGNAAEIRLQKQTDIQVKNDTRLTMEIDREFCNPEWPKSFDVMTYDHRLMHFAGVAWYLLVLWLLSTRPSHPEPVHSEMLEVCLWM